jgi:hypothetical protein
MKRNSTFVKMMSIVMIFAMYTFTINAQTTVLKAGSNVSLEFSETVSSKTHNTGQKVNLTVKFDVSVGDKVVIAAGAPAEGKVIDKDERGIVGQPGSIGVQIERVQAVNGEWINVSATQVSKGKDKTTTSIIVTLLCILGLLIKGDEGKLNAGSTIDARVVADFTLTDN